MMTARASVSTAAFTGLALLLAGCASSGSTSSTAYSETITPIQNTPVASSNLPALGSGQVAGNTIAAPGQQTPLNAPPGLNPSLNAPPGLNPSLNRTPQPGLTDQFGNPLVVANANTGFGGASATGRDLSGGLTTRKLAGTWTVVGGTQQCSLNLTETAMTGTGRFRASAPGCALRGMHVLASWQLAGNQVQLFDENGDLVANLLLSGNRFIGTLAGGQGISMVG